MSIKVPYFNQITVEIIAIRNRILLSIVILTAISVVVFYIGSYFAKLQRELYSIQISFPTELRMLYYLHDEALFIPESQSLSSSALEIQQQFIKDRLAKFIQLNGLYQKRQNYINRYNQNTLIMFNKIDSDLFQIPQQEKDVRLRLQQLLKQSINQDKTFGLKTESPLSAALFSPRLWMPRYNSQFERINTLTKEHHQKRETFIIVSIIIFLLTSLFVVFLIIIPPLEKILKTDKALRNQITLREYLSTVLVSFSQPAQYYDLDKSNLFNDLCEAIALNDIGIVLTISSQKDTYCSSDNYVQGTFNCREIKKNIFIDSMDTGLVSLQYPYKLQTNIDDLNQFFEVLIGIISDVVNIHIRIKLEQQSHQYYKFIESAIGHVPLAISIFSNNEKLSFYNNRFKSILGSVKTGTSLQEIASLIQGNNITSDQSIAILFCPGKNEEFELEDKNKRLFHWQRIKISSLGWIFIGRDITDERAALADKEHKYRLEMVGRISSSLAHDTNNLLAVIRSNIELSLVTKEPEKIESLLLRAISTCDNIGEMNKELLNYSKKLELKNEIIELKNLLHEVNEYVKSIGIENIFQLVVTSKNNIRADVIYTKSALLNVIKNAYEAVGFNGTIKLIVSDCLLKDQAMVRFDVVDNGPGFSEQDLIHAFEPFYTRKAIGTGLGLSTVQGIVKASGGIVEINNTQQGTCVSLLFCSAYSI